MYRGVAEGLVEFYEYDWGENLRLKETCICSVEMLCANIVNVIIVMLLATILNIQREALIFAATFAAMRFYAGGAHAKNYGQCITIYSLVLLICINIARACMSLDYVVICAICVLCISIVCLASYKYAAISSTVTEKISHYRRKNFIILGVMGTVMILLGSINCYVDNIALHQLIKEGLLLQSLALFIHSISLWLENK